MSMEIGRVSFADGTYETVIRFEKHENGDKVIYARRHGGGMHKYCIHYVVEQIPGTELLRKRAEFYKSVLCPDDTNVNGFVEKWLPCNHAIVKIAIFPRE